MINEKEQMSIDATKKEFEKSFRENTYYNKQTRDEEHLTMLKEFVAIEDGMKILDLGTGTGFLALEFAKTNQNTYVIGLDIVEEALQKNRETAKREKINNVEFVTYGGSAFPFEDQSFDLVVTRYAIHHFPNIKATCKEISRVLKPMGRVMISDPTPNENDKDGFVDAYMQMKKDGHIKFYRKEELIELMTSVGLAYEKDFVTAIRFPKKRETAVEFDEIISKNDKAVIDGYDVKVTENEIYITEKVLNIMFKKIDKESEL